MQRLQPKLRLKYKPTINELRRFDNPPSHKMTKTFDDKFLKNNYPKKNTASINSLNLNFSKALLQKYGLNLV